MATTREREEFVGAMVREGVPVEVARKVMRHAASIQRYAELACSSEAADRDRAPCPGYREGDKGRTACLCRDYGSAPNGGPALHGDVPRYAVQDERAQARIVALLAPFGVVPDFQGDPRGACVKLRVPSGRTDDWGQTGLCVPA